MKVTMVMVSSVDGIVSRQSQESVKTWTSIEDQHHLIEIVRKCDAVITGRKSFTKRIAEVPYYVYSRSQKSTDEDKAGGLFFTEKDPTALLEELQNLQFEEVLLLGGPEINSLFLNAKLVDEIIITIEPKLFGKGKHLASSEFELDLKLIDLKKLNKNGTLLVTYAIKKTID